MAMVFAGGPKLFGAKGRRETVLVLSAGLVAIVGIGYGVHAHGRSSTPVEQGWAGHLVAAVVPDAPQAVTPMSSASLVVPKAQLALPPAPPKPAVRVKASCDSADKYCVVRPSAAPATATVVPPRRQVVASLDAPALLLPPATIPEPKLVAEKKAEPVRKSFFASLNPLDHMPDVSVVGRPFAAAGTTVTGWIKKF